ncbi:MAG: rhodanese-like domain-containing protein [Treponema pedis]|uniref:rhodanese-like domain-containing protein n=1 Tax=Treponema pedis TaxID=409322 RepID=UPI003133F753
MKKIFMLYALIVFIFTACAETVIVKDVKGSRLEFLNSEEKKDSILIIDTRPYTQYKNKHLPNAINIPKEEIKARMNEVEDWKNRPIYIYANNDDDSFEAAKILVENGCKVIFNAEGLDQYLYQTVTYHCVRGSVFEKQIQSADAVIVDCRTKGAYDAGHIENALSIPIIDLEKNFDKLPKDKKIFLYCNVGTASARIAATLSNMGYPEVYNSIDGVKEYPFKLVYQGAK